MEKKENNDNTDTNLNEFNISALAFSRTEPILTASIMINLSVVELDLFNRVNAYRVSNGRSPLLLDSRLQLAAKNHNDLMAFYKTMSHQLPGELPLAAFGTNNDRYDLVGYNWNYAAENIARGYTSTASVMAAWISSPGHNANLLSPNARDIGVAYNSNGNFWTQNFGNSFGPTQPL